MVKKQDQGNVTSHMTRALASTLAATLVLLAAHVDAHPVSSDPYAPLLSIEAAGFDAGERIRTRALAMLERAARERIARDGRLVVDERARGAIVARLSSLDPVAAEFYAARRYLPAFVSTEGLTPAGEALLRVLDAAPEHGLPVDAFDASGLRADALAIVAPDHGMPLASRVDDRFVVALIDELVRQGADPGSDDAVVAAADRVGHQGYRSWYADTRNGLRERVDTVADDVVALDLRMAGAAIAWMRVMRWDHAGQRVGAPAEWHPLVGLSSRRRELGAADVAAMVGVLSSGADGLEAAMATVPPQRATYADLQRGLARYRAIEAAGGWDDLGALDTRRPGDRGGDVLRLRTRLAAEGYLAEADGPSVYDAGIELAVAEFQRTRGLPETGEVDDATLDALDVSVALLVDRIELGLQRLRESRTDHAAQATLVRVNVPGYRAEVWRGAELMGTWDVMVGRPQGPNPTPLFSDVLDYMELNPWWYAPIRLGRGGMAPGPNNPMGQVKFIFSNPWAVYLHDTNHRELFDQHPRALSSGCIRVREPIELAVLLRTLDIGVDEATARAEIDAILAEGRTNRLHFATSIGVHLEYVLVDAEADGTVLFHDDLYDLEDAALAAVGGGMAAPPFVGPT